MRGRGGYVNSWLILAMSVFLVPGRELVVAAPAALRAFVRDERAYQLEKMWRAQFFRLNDASQGSSRRESRGRRCWA